MTDLDDQPVVVDATDRLPVPRRVLFEVTWEPWPDRDPERVDSMLRARVARSLDRLTDDLGRVAADVHVATAPSADHIPAARRLAARVTYAEQRERDAAASRAAWGDLEPGGAPSPNPSPSTPGDDT